MKSVDEHPDLFEHGMYWSTIAVLAQYSGIGSTRIGSLKSLGVISAETSTKSFTKAGTPHFLNMAYMLLNEDNGEELTVFDVVRLKRQIYATWKCTDPQVDLVECLEQTKRILEEARPYLSTHEEL
ncbi:hypothetical protein AAVH_24509 [Aphelenchoides avenae]|nr:hypothetical protein AAVH_24509 [Aphelenchus avenae]